MNSHFCGITEANKLTLNKPADSDMVYYSELKEWYTVDAFRSFSLKYVVDRCIYYKSGNREHAVEAGQFLMACRQPHVKAYFDSGSMVKSICIDIRPETIAEASTVMLQHSDHDFDNYLAGYFCSPVFFESVTPLSPLVPFAGQLNELVATIGKVGTSLRLSREWFLRLAEQVILHEYGNYLALNNIQSVRTTTRHELLRRLLRARQYMDDIYLSIEDVHEVAHAGNLSEFHFYRSFRQAFGITPYQYILGRRLELARMMLEKRNQSITEIALHCNFPDIYTFSKAFKRKFGVPPSALLVMD